MSFAIIRYQDFRSRPLHGLLLIASLWVGASQLMAQTATYDITFEGLWTSANHPLPPNPHFSPLVGASHNDSVELWAVGELASSGIERMAEFGSVNVLRTEVQAAGTDNASFIQGNGLGATGTTTVTVEVDIERPLVTLVTMIAPSPDWFVGTSGLDLLAAGRFADSLVYDLYAYDAGTDSGPDFTSPDDNSVPREPIHLLGAPLAGTPPLGTFTFELQSVTGLTGDFDGDGDYALADIDRLVEGIVAGTNSPGLDLNSDGLVNQGDLDAWLAEAGAAELASGNPYLPGDADLDGSADVVDFNIWSMNKFEFNTGWSGADFDADGTSDISDFNIWNLSKFQSSNPVAAVPEPTALSLLALAALPLCWLRRRQNSSTGVAKNIR